MKDKKIPQRQDWFVEWSTSEDASHHKNGREKGAAASRITTTESYIKYNGFESSVIDGIDEAGREYLIKKFPYFQEAQGDGFCVLHASIVGILAKCVDNKKKFEEFKENLRNWGEDNELKPSHKKQFDRVLEKLNKKDNIRYQDFYDLVNEKGSENISTILSQILFKYSDFDDIEKIKEFSKYYGELYEVEGKKAGIEDEQWKLLKDQQKKKAVEFITDIGAIFMLYEISPFEIEFITGDNLRSISTNKDTIYLSHGKGHFNLLHSSEDKNLLRAVENLSSGLVPASLRGSFYTSDVGKIFPDNNVSGQNFTSSSDKNSSRIEAGSLKTGSKQPLIKDSEKVNSFGKIPKSMHNNNKLSDEEREEIIQTIFIKSLNKIKGTDSVKEKWNSLSLLEKKVMVHCYNQSHQDDEIKLSSLYRKSKPGENVDITTKYGNHFVFRQEKESDVLKILYHASRSIPEAEVSVNKTERLDHGAKIQEM